MTRARVSMAREHEAQILGRHHDLVGESQPRVHERPPVRQMIVGFPAVVVEHDAFVQAACDGHRGNRSQQKRPVRRREHVHDVGTAARRIRLGRYNIWLTSVRTYRTSAEPTAAREETSD